MSDIDKFIRDQLSVWPLAAGNFRLIKNAQYKEFTVGSQKVVVQMNPCRIASSTADIDPETISARKCFLCPENRPKEQFHLKYEGKKGRSYNIQVNPFPIFRNHLVIARDQHLPQTIWHHFPDMLLFSRLYPEYTVYYNGPVSGASAPDHLHFQACPRNVLPVEKSVDAFLDAPGEPLASVQDATLYKFEGYARGIYALKATTQKSMAKLAYRLLECSPRVEGENEPRFNLYCWYKGGEFRTMVALRSQFRSHHYASTGEDQLTMSPGAAEMAGFFVAPVPEDFAKINGKLLAEMIDEVSVSPEEERMVGWRLSRQQPLIDVGIMAAEEIRFEIISDGAGPQRVSFCDGRINYNGALYDSLTFDAVTRSTLFAEPTFILYDVPIGIGFHWEQKLTRRFAGRLSFIVEGDRIRAVNRIGEEDYLLSVISSEMRSTAPVELLKAHAIIARSWLRRNLGSHGSFDVCADDHCQRYQGLDGATGAGVRDAIDQTWGQVLTYGGEICDARYSKCCGGRTEIFSTCWSGGDKPYLSSVEDPYCAKASEELLRRSLNDYDLPTTDYLEWELRYSRDELSELLARRTGEDFGTVRSLLPVETGASGRIKTLRIVGSKCSMTVGPELAVRRALSESHLKSSNFTVTWEGDTCVLHGRGWGHGVGLCQIGAAEMAAEGFTCEEILKHYYTGSEIVSVDE